MAFDTINSDTLWSILSEIGYHPTFVHLAKQLPTDMEA